MNAVRFSIACFPLAASCASSPLVYYGEDPPAECRVVGEIEASDSETDRALAELEVRARAAGVDAVVVRTESWADYVGPAGLTGGGEVTLSGELLECRKLLRDARLHLSATICRPTRTWYCPGVVLGRGGDTLAAAPRTRLAWGRMEAEGLGTARDMKLWPGGGRAWDWRETGTHHVPGIQVADVEELLANGARTVVLSRGMELVLQTCPETLEYLETRGVQVHVAETNEAARIYNELVERGEAVGGLFHSTC